jgi:hypothetical protein
MRITALAASFALAALSLSPPQRPPPPAAPEIHDEADLAAPAEEGLHAAVEAPRTPLTPTLQVEETSAPVPKDLKVLVRADKGAGWTVTLTRPRHLVTLRRLDQRRAGEDRVSFKVARGEEASEPLVWESTGLDGLSTTRGTLRLDGAGHAALRLATPPRLVGAIEKHQRHSCQAQDDGFGGQSVLCRVEAWVTAANLGAADPGENIAYARPEGSAKLVRFDFPAGGPSVTAMVLGYTDGLDGVVVRAEQSFLPGEAGPSLTLLSDVRRQPMMLRPTHWHERFDPIDMIF